MVPVLGSSLSVHFHCLASRRRPVVSAPVGPTFGRVEGQRTGLGLLATPSLPCPAGPSQRSTPRLLKPARAQGSPLGRSRHGLLQSMWQGLSSRGTSHRRTPRPPA